MPVFICTNNCQVIDCEVPDDLLVYAPQTWPNFLSPLLSFLVQCPVGYVCHGFPKVITYPPGTFVVYVPPNPPAGYIIRMQGCQSEVTAIVPAGATPAQVAALAQSVMQQVAQQQSECDAFIQDPPPQPKPAFMNEVVYFVHECEGDEGLNFSGTLPSWITLDEDNFRLIGAAGVFGGATQAEATATAQATLNAFVNAALVSGDLSCMGGFWNVEQSVDCPIGETGGPFVVSAHTYFSDVSQAAADAEALAAAQAEADATCFDCLGNSDTLAGLSWTETTTFNLVTGNGFHSTTITPTGDTGTFDLTTTVPGGVINSGGKRIITLEATFCNATLTDKTIRADFVVNYSLVRSSTTRYDDGGGSGEFITTLFNAVFANSGEGLSKSGTENHFKFFPAPAHSLTVISFEFITSMTGEFSTVPTGTFHMDGTFALTFV